MDDWEDVIEIDLTVDDALYLLALLELGDDCSRAEALGAKLEDEIDYALSRRAVAW